MYYESEKLPSELLGERERFGNAMRLTVSSRQVLPREFRDRPAAFSLFDRRLPVDEWALYDAFRDGVQMDTPEYESLGTLEDTLPPDPSPFAEDEGDTAIVEALQQALDAVADIDRDDPVFEDAMQEVYPTLAKAMFSGGDEYTHKMTITAEAWLTREGNDWVLRYMEPEENGLGETLTAMYFPVSEDKDGQAGTDKTVRIQRGGDMDNLLVLVEGKRLVSNYYMKPLMRSFDLCVYTRRLDWTIDPVKGGTIFLDYILEIRGADVQRTTLRLDLKPLAKKTDGSEDVQ